MQEWINRADFGCERITQNVEIIYLDDAHIKSYMFSTGTISRLEGSIVCSSHFFTSSSEFIMNSRKGVVISTHSNDATRKIEVRWEGDLEVAAITKVTK